MLTLHGYSKGMSFFVRATVSILLLSGYCLLRDISAEPVAETSAVVESNKANEMTAPAPARVEIDAETIVVDDYLIIPTPGEFFAAIRKTGAPDWTSHYRKPIPVTFTSRPQIALNLGGLITDGYIAVAARDGQQVKNIGRDIIALAKSIGVGENVIGRGSSITQFAENNEWEALSEELEATENEVKLSMMKLQDEDLISLVSLGAWIRGVEVVSSMVEADYSPERAQMLRQPELLEYLKSKIPQMADSLQSDELVVYVGDQLGQMVEYVSFPVESPVGQEDVTKLHGIAGTLNERISSK